MAGLLLFTTLALLCSGLVVEGLYCKECLMETDSGGCLITAGTCNATETCMTILIQTDPRFKRERELQKQIGSLNQVKKEKEVKFRIYGCFVSDHYRCGMSKKTGGHLLNVRCCASRHLCNKKFHY